MSIVIPFVAEDGADETPDWIISLNEALPEHRIVLPENMSDAEKQAAEVAIVANPDPADLEVLPKLKWVQSLWAGVEKLLAQLPEAKFEIVRMTDPQLAETMAEAAVAWTMYIHRDIPLYREQQTKKIWKHHFPPLPSERTVSILGMGNLGKASARQLKLNGFTVQGWSNSGKNIPDVTIYSGADGLRKMLNKTDILIVLLPLTEQTQGLINDDFLSQLADGASVINFARGPIIDDAALIRALDAGTLFHAVLDVFAVEPLPESNPYWEHPKVTVTPHISAPTNMTTASAIAADNIRAFIEHGAVPAGVDRKKGY